MAPIANAKPQPSQGSLATRPEISTSFWLPFCCTARPIPKKIALFTSEWPIICSNPANVAAGPPTPKAKAAMPICSIELQPKKRRASRLRQRASDASSTEARPKAISKGPTAIVPGCAPTIAFARSTASMAAFSKSPDNTAEIAIGPSACASGSQECSGTRPALVP